MVKQIKNVPILKNTSASKHLNEKGYTIFPFLTKADVEQLSTFYFSIQKENPDYFYATTHSNNIQFRHQANDFIKQVFKPLLDSHFENYSLLGGAFVVKPPHGKGILEAHQDWNLVDETIHRSYNLWVPLVDVDENNGAVFVLPCSHLAQSTVRGPHIPSVFKQIEKEIWPHLTALPMKAGEALLYDHALLHGSPPNQSNKIRLGVVIGMVSKFASLQLYGNDQGTIKAYDCDASFFLNKDVLKDFVHLPLKSVLDIKLKTLSIKEFKSIYVKQQAMNNHKQEEQVEVAKLRTFFETYTLKNILAEIKYRLSASKPIAKKENSLVNTPNATENSANQVAEFYNSQTDNFLKVYGNVIQAFRTKQVSSLLKHQQESMGMKQGMKALDAGCGVCGPAIYFAQNSGIEIEAITISSVQAQKSQLEIERYHLQNQIKVKEGDYHHLEKYYPNNHFDLIYFLESFGHAVNHLQVLDSAWHVLKPGGMIYIKDLFQKKSLNTSLSQQIEKEIQNINKAYHYNVPQLNSLLDYARAKGYILSALKTIDIPLEEFENLSISNEFQELTGINKIDNLRSYVFPVDFFELKLIKPEYNVELGNSRYFLQNMYFLQIQNWKENEL